MIVDDRRVKTGPEQWALKDLAPGTPVELDGAFGVVIEEYPTGTYKARRKVAWVRTGTTYAPDETTPIFVKVPNARFVVEA